jgi:hypothetical protein
VGVLGHRHLDRGERPGHRAAAAGRLGGTSQIQRLVIARETLLPRRVGEPAGAAAAWEQRRTGERAEAAPLAKPTRG